ncbi:MAG: DUF971 domain-containing protein [Verrucomicrobiota bacterium]|nr:DUF971 domain-containing protein [Verrucomicrobiota bacterium]
MRLAPANIQIIGDEVAIKWTDDVETFLALDSLRRACPCATCSGEPDVLGRVARPGVAKAASSKIRSYEIVGGYAFQPTWEDGHNTGLYTFALLRRLAAGNAA